MERIVLYHNPNCSKSRGAKEILEGTGIEFDVIEYLQTPLSADDVIALLGLLEGEPADLVRKDSHFKELGLNSSPVFLHCTLKLMLDGCQATPRRFINFTKFGYVFSLNTIKPVSTG